MKKNVILLLMVFFTLSSCQRLLLMATVKSDITKELKTLESPDKKKTLVFFPMVHMGKKGYYESCKKHIDSLRKEGYTFFCEGMQDFSGIDSLERDTTYRKVRKLLGFYLGGKGYKNKDNKSLSAHLRNNSYIEQDYAKMGLKATDKFVDYDYYNWVKDYEKAKGKIILTDCDFETPLTEKYKCNRDDVSYHFATSTLRDQRLVKTILESKNAKIAVIYGRQHWFFVWADLRDKGWKIIKGKI